ncbi:MAG: DegT/DnrJ/EryC1/StrS family aminotransferase [Candidatus Korarchaeum sp.]|nr:DegT/DnrJ/EryC1/StrS family aminotransferase [Candidatus Korarchaeum sp.]MDW8035082.1 DegT/DnrJ/EryC1/StrS family aminotransferase [Candidatus Korarchaeum sp.]
MIPISKPCISETEIANVVEVLRSGMLAQGSFVEKFERSFSSYIGSKYAIAVSNGTAALHVALIAMGVGPGDEVIVPSYSFFATASVVVLTGAKPVFADVDLRTGTIDPEAVRVKLSERTKAIIPVHIHGHPADLDAIRDALGSEEILILEDCAQAHGALYKGRKVGGIGDVGAFSFYPTKNMTTGEGGIITTDDEEVYYRARVIRDQGQVSKYEHHFIGFNYRMTEINAAIGLAQLEKLDGFNKRRKEIASIYSEELSNFVETPYVAEWADPVWHLYPVRVKKRDKALKMLVEKGVIARSAYPMPLQEQPAISKLNDRYYNFLSVLFERFDPSSTSTPNAKTLCNEILYLPIYHCMTDEEVESVVRVSKEVFKSI